MKERPEALPREARITKRDDFERVKKEGTWIRSENFDLIHSCSAVSYTRLGVIVPLYTHNVVERNRLKRRVKEVMRRHVLKDLETSRDIIIRARKMAYEIDFEYIRRELIDLSNIMRCGGGGER